MRLMVKYFKATFEEMIKQSTIPSIIVRTIFCLLLFLSANNDVHGQTSASGSFLKLSCAEKWWVIGHPFVAKKAYKITIEARLMSDSLKNHKSLDGDANGGQIDAFRHSYWMARLAQTMSWRKAIRLGRAHERANYKSFKHRKSDEEGSVADSISTEMDLFNNKIGVTIGCNNRNCSKKELENMIMNALLQGRMRVISKDLNGNPLDCNGQRIDQKIYIGIWNIPKCLTSSAK